MTEKRFKLFVGKNYGVQKVDGEVIFDSMISMAEADVLVDLLNDLNDENVQLKQQLTDCKEKKQQMKEFFMNSEPVIEQKKLQKLIYQTVINLIDDKIDELQKKYDFGQKNGFYPMYNYNIRHSINVLKKMKKELEE